MNIPLWIVLVTVFAFSALLVYALLASASSWLGRLTILANESVVSDVAQQFELLGRKVQGKRLPFMESAQNEMNWRSSEIALQCIRAGYRTYNAVLTVIGSKIFMTVVGAATGLFLGFQLEFNAALMIALSLLLSAIGFFLPDWVLRVMVRRRQAIFLEHFPDALDLIRICLEAGLGLDAAIIRVGEEFRKICPPLQDELHTLSLELRAGASRTQCLRNFGERTGLQDVQALVTLLVQADKFGTGIADAVRVHSEQLRLNRKLKAEEAAAKVSVKLLFPLIFFIFPALLLVLLGPAAISLYENLNTGLLNR